MGIISPVISFAIKEEKYPSPSERVKLSKAIGKYRLMLQRYDVGEVKFALADLLVGRGEPEDCREALNLYEEILAENPKGRLLAKTLVGKAELAIISGGKKEAAESIALCDKAFRILKRDYTNFFGAKAVAVKAELLHKRKGKGDHGKALGLFGKIMAKPAHWYFRARAMVGKAELLRYRRPKDLSVGIELCERALKILARRPHDYFTIKAKVIQSELRIRRNLKADLEKAKLLSQRVISDPEIHRDLVARAKLNLAEISILDRAKELHAQVLEMEGLDPYIIKKARVVERALKTRTRKYKSAI